MPSAAEIIAQYDHLTLHDANEAETRLKVINDVLYSVLGWSHADVNVEQRVSEDGTTTWSDYTLKTGMAAIYDTLYDESIRRGLSREWCSHPLRAMKSEFEKNLNRVMSSAERNYGADAPKKSVN